MNRRVFSLIVLLWIVVGTIHGLSRYSDIVRYGLDVPFSMVDVGYFVLSYAFWVVITVVLLKVMRAERFRFSFGQLTACFVVGIVLWLPIYFSYDYGMSTLIAGGGWQDWTQKFAETSGSVVFFYAVVYALTFALCGSVTLASRARAAESEKSALEQQRAVAALALSEQQMQLMQSQLSPHFLFNCLSAISYLARNEDRKTLTDAVAKLGNLLRFTIENASRPTITIADELRFCEDYVGLQTLRFGNRFRFLLDVDPCVANAYCPPFTIQPLIENVFRHVVEQ
ncbi:MAG: sensor histidine kinase, partial [Pseudomonadota bacterium]